MDLMRKRVLRWRLACLVELGSNLGEVLLGALLLLDLCADEALHISHRPSMLLLSG